MAVVNITKENYDEIATGDKPVLIDFYAEWCNPCKMMFPIVEEIADEYPNYVVGKINVTKETELAAVFGITTVPAFMTIELGDVMGSVFGPVTKDQIKALLHK